MYCPQCKGEYRQGFTRCSDCDVELVENYVEAFRHPLARKVAVGDEYGARLWHGGDPHFYVGLLWSLSGTRRLLVMACLSIHRCPSPRGGRSLAVLGLSNLKFGFRKRTYPSQSGFSNQSRKNLRKSRPRERT